MPVDFSPRYREIRRVSTFESFYFGPLAHGAAEPVSSAVLFRITLIALALASCAHRDMSSRSPEPVLDARSRVKPPTAPTTPAEPAEPASTAVNAITMASDDLAAIVARERLAGTWRIGPLEWNPAFRTISGQAWLVFAVDPTDPLEDPPFLSVDTFQLDPGPPLRMVSHAEPAKLAAVAGRIADLEASLALARQALKALPRYTYWRKGVRRYETQIRLDRRGRVTFWFTQPTVSDNDVLIEIDSVNKVVVAVRVGSA